MSDPQRPGRGIALVGARGTGKSTVGRLLAATLGWTFHDADDALELRAGRPIRAIFAEDGEAVFRDWEERVIAELTGSPETVLATGGGAVLRPINRRRLRDFGFVVWLRADPGMLAARLEADREGLTARPALTAKGTLAEIESILAARTPLYNETADAAVDTDGRSPNEVAGLVVDLWNVAKSRETPEE